MASRRASRASVLPWVREPALRERHPVSVSVIEITLEFGNGSLRRPVKGTDRAYALDPSLPQTRVLAYNDTCAAVMFSDFCHKYVMHNNAAGDKTALSLKETPRSGQNS